MIRALKKMMENKKYFIKIIEKLKDNNIEHLLAKKSDFTNFEYEELFYKFRKNMKKVA